MKWPLRSQSVAASDIPLYNLHYLCAPGAAQVDTTILWGTEVDVETLLSYLQERNRDSGILLSTSHVLVQAIAQTLVRHSEFNRRVVGRRIYTYREINLRLAFQNRRRKDVGVLLVPRANELSLTGIANCVWSAVVERLQGKSAVDRDTQRLLRLPGFLFEWVLRTYNWLDRHLRLPTVGRLDGLRSGAVFINDLSFHGAPPMRSYKPSRFPDESAPINITLGPSETKAVVCDGRVEARTVSPLFVRADHRIVDAYQIGCFVATLRELLQDPARMENRPAVRIVGAGDAQSADLGRPYTEDVRRAA